MSDLFVRSLADLPEPDRASADKVRARANDILRPPGALARLDELAVWLAAWQRTDEPDVVSPEVLVFAADHGVAAVGVSAYPAEVTSAMLAAVQQRRATVSALAESVGAMVRVFDVGVGNPTANLANEAAMTIARFEASFEAGQSAVANGGADLVAIGELGIGNTTAAAAISAALIGGDPAGWVGRGTGIDDEGFVRKQQVVEAALTRIGAVPAPFEVLRQVGGCEIAAMAGAIAEARQRCIPVLLDGYIATSAAVVLHAANPDAVSHCRAGHVSGEPGHTRQLEHLGLQPILCLDMRLGEGSGAVAAIPIVKMAARATTQVATFSEWFAQ